MKLLSVILLFVPSIVIAQKNKDKSPATLDSVVYNIDPETYAPSELNLPFKNIDIIDARFDTSKIGFVYFRRTIDLNYKDFKRVKLEAGVAKAIEHFYNEYYSKAFKDASKRLLIVFKKLWIDYLPNRDIDTRRHDIVRNTIQDIHVKAELYLNEQHDFYPLKRVDTVYQLTEENLGSKELDLKKNDLSFFVFTLKSVIEKIDFLKLAERVNYAKKYSTFQIDSFNRKRFMVPVLVDEKINNGVFMTFKEFANNKPSLTEYRITERGILKDANDSAVSYRYWGYYDKNGFHVNKSKEVTLWRIGNTFEFFITGAVFLQKSVAGNLIELMPDPFYIDPSVKPGPGYKLRFVSSPRQIDMETGDVY